MTDAFGDVELLTAAEERELAMRIEAGALAWAERHAEVRRTDARDEELLALERLGHTARQRFVQANVGLVGALVSACAARTGLPRDELFQEGCLGLVIAVARFDHRRGLRFSTYAVPWIRSRLGEAVLRRCGALPLPAGRAGQLQAARAAADELAQTLGRPATTAEIAARAGLDRRGYERLLAWQRVTSLDVAIADRAGEPAAPDEAGDAEPDPPVAELLWRLAPDEREVLRLRYGFGDGAARSTAAVARRLGRSTSAVRRVEERALRRLRGWCAEAPGTMTA
ncbi:MAG TPA: sigma-70 family RNA polymerase sigma factor [Microlunatus sp.]|nr:sigma-70 family RNA polymerase sigma factor [Microlunatus sp.]